MPIKDLADLEGDEEEGLPTPPVFDPSEDQISIVERLQLKVLQRLEWLLDNHLISSTDMSTLVKLLSQNGWNLDPNKVPQHLKDKLLGKISFDDDDESDDVIPISRKQA